MPNVQNLTMKQGEDRTFTLYARDWTNSPLSLTGATLQWRVGMPPANIDQNWPTFTKTGTVTGSSTGTYTVSVSAVDTKYLDGDYEYQSWATISGQSYVVTEGRLRIQNMIGP